MSNFTFRLLLGISYNNTSAAGLNNAPALTNKTPNVIVIRLSGWLKMLAKEIIHAFLVKDMRIDLLL